MNVRYFFIADRVKSKEIRIEYCPTGIMVADYFTKALQGITFRHLRDMIMGNTEIALPSDPVTSAAGKLNGIPVMTTQQESRSVLNNDMLTDRPPRFLTALCRTPHGKAKTIVIGEPDQPITSKRMLSWAEVVVGGKRG